MKSAIEFQASIAVLMLMTACILLGCASNGAMGRVELTDFVFYYPRGFAPVPGASEKEVVLLYGDWHGNSINVSHFWYLAGSDLSEAVCTGLAEAFNKSELRTRINASKAIGKKFTFKDGLKSCYYSYDFQGPKGKSRVEYKVYQGNCSKSYAVTAVYAGDSQKQGLIQEALHSFKLKDCIPQRAGSLPPTSEGMASFVLIDKSERAYTVFMAIPEDKQQEVRSKIAGKKDVFLVEWSEFSQKKDEHLSSNILKNEYQDSRVVDGMYQLLKRAPGVPFGLTWNGGVAITRNDYQYARKTFERYMASPEDYERTRVRDPRADPVKPEWHFGPLLGW